MGEIRIYELSKRNADRICKIRIFILLQYSFIFLTGLVNKELHNEI